MSTIVIYDNTGHIFSAMNDSIVEPQGGIQYLRVEIPQGKQIKLTDGIGVDVSVTPHQVILENIPPTEIQLLESKLQATQEAVDFLIMGGM